eukprot:scaffold20395_cov128-Isochrysis_galbana.AAC.5
MSSPTGAHTRPHSPMGSTESSSYIPANPSVLPMDARPSCVASLRQQHARTLPLYCLQGASVQTAPPMSGSANHRGHQATGSGKGAARTLSITRFYLFSYRTYCPTALIRAPHTHASRHGAAHSANTRGLAVVPRCPLSRLLQVLDDADSPLGDGGIQIRRVREAAPHQLFHPY